MSDPRGTLPADGETVQRRSDGDATAVHGESDGR